MAGYGKLLFHQRVKVVDSKRVEVEAMGMVEILEGSYYNEVMSTKESFGDINVKSILIKTFEQYRDYGSKRDIKEIKKLSYDLVNKRVKRAFN